MSLGGKTAGRRGAEMSDNDHAGRMAAVTEDIDGILFDKDGTLLDFAATWMPAYVRVAHELAGDDAATADRILAASGFDRGADRLDPTSVLAAGTNLEIAALWAPFLGIRDVAGLEARLDAGFQAHAAGGLVPVAELTALFRRLRSRGVALGVATNDSAGAAARQLADLGIDSYLCFVAGYDSGHGGKPGPGMVRAFCQAAALPASRVAVVGDSLHDLEMGRAAGAGLLVGVLTGASPRALLATLADHVIASIEELEALLDRCTSAADPVTEEGTVPRSMS
jgi:phosphoglycolate phosphatase